MDWNTVLSWVQGQSSQRADKYDEEVEDRAYNKDVYIYQSKTFGRRLPLLIVETCITSKSCDI